VVAVIGLALLPFTSRGTVPSFKEPDLLIRLQAAPGTSRIEMDRIVARLGDELKSVSGVTSVGAHVGRALLSDRLEDVNSGEVWLSIDPSAHYDSTSAAIRQVVNGYPGLRHEIHSYLEDRTAPLAADAPPLVVRVFGDDQSRLRSVADDVQRALADVPGIAAQHLQVPAQQPTVDISVDLAAAQRYGLKPGDIRRAAATLVAGLQVGSLFEDQKVFDVVVWGAPETRGSLSSVHDLLLDTPDGRHVRLGDVARVQIVPSVSVVRHQDVHDYLDERIDVRGRSVAAVAADINERLQHLQFPMEYHAEVLGSYAEQEASQVRLISASVAAVLAILLVLQAGFGSWGLAAFALFLLPVSLVGGLIAIVVMGGAIGLGAVAGLLAAAGVSARTIIALVRRCQVLQRQEGRALSANLVRRAAGDRVGPVLATAVATGLALTPFVVWGNTPGFELVRPLAIVAISGLISATLVNLFVLPAACLLLAGEPAQAEVPAVSLPVTAPVVGQASD
jgi:Cu/Ag efflux pump CusA